LAWNGIDAEFEPDQVTYFYWWKKPATDAGLFL